MTYQLVDEMSFLVLRWTAFLISDSDKIGSFHGRFFYLDSREARRADSRSNRPRRRDTVRH